MKSFIFRVIILTLISAIFLGGCGKEENSMTIASNKEEITWQDLHTDLGKEYGLVAVTEDMIYGCYKENDEIVIACQNKVSGNIEKVRAFSDLSYIKNIDADGEGNVYIVGDKESENVLCKIDTAGNLQEIGDFLLEDTEKAINIDLRGIKVDSEGNIFLWYEMGILLNEIFDDAEEDVYGMVDRIYIMDSQLNSLFYEQVINVRGTELLNFSLNEAEEPLVIVNDNEGIYIQRIDRKEQKLSDMTRMDNNISTSEIVGDIAVTENGFLFCQGNGLYEYNEKKQDCEKILNLSSYGIDPYGILYMGMDDDKIEIIDNYGNDDNSEYVVLRKGLNEKTVLTLGVMQVTQNLEKKVADFNRSNGNIRIEIVPYYTGENGFEEGMEHLKLDIIRGKAPDIIDVSEIDYAVYSDKGVLADLYGFMQNDEECKMNDIMDSVSDAYEISGHLYSIAPAFQLYSMWGSNMVIKDRHGVTLGELIQILEESGKSLDAINGFSADEPVLTTLCTFGMDEFVEWEEGVCNFDGEYFKEIVAFAEKYKGSYEDGSQSRGIDEGRIVMSVGIITSVADYQIQSKLYKNDFAFIGYPTNDGSGTAISFRGSELSINAQSEKKEEAWEFVKYYLLNGYDGQGFPSLKAQFEAVMQKAGEADFSIEEDGNSYEVPKGYYTDEDIELQVYAANQDDINAVRKLIDSAVNKFEYNTEILGIIDEETEAYFAGQKDLDSVTDVIQNRVQIYLQENKRQYYLY
ncbi:MAG: extracellular solute-binding protein [Lachnospiraceae bacterium]|nr:extracellular solute-binding protein [Lachnospiraceae bacterium]